MIAGIIIPPNAANIGSEAFLKLESSPSIISRLISKPTRRKNTAIKPSFTQVATEYFKWKTSVPTSASNNAWNCSPKEEFAVRSEAITHKINITPEDWLLLKKFLKYLVSFILIFSLVFLYLRSLHFGKPLDFLQFF